MKDYTIVTLWGKSVGGVGNCGGIPESIELYHKIQKLKINQSFKKYLSLSLLKKYRLNVSKEQVAVAKAQACFLSACCGTNGREHIHACACQRQMCPISNKPQPGATQTIS